MNKKQLIAMWVGIGIIVFMGIFPPFMLKVSGQDCYVGYGFIAPLPQDYFELLVTFSNESATMIDFTRLLTQWTVVSALTAGFIITFKGKKR